MLETARLTLRPPCAEDFDAFAGLHTHPEASRFVGGVLPRGIAWRQFGHIRASWQLGGIGQFSVVRRDSGAWIGMAGPWRLFGWPGAEVRWEIAPEHWRRGYGREAAGAALQWLFEAKGWREAAFFIHTANLASRRLAEGLGAEHCGRGRMNPPFQAAEAEIYRCTPADFAARTAQPRQAARLNRA